MIKNTHYANFFPYPEYRVKGVIMFLDSRFKDKINWISRWIKHEIEIVLDKKNMVAKQVVKFWNS